LGLLARVAACVLSSCVFLPGHPDRSSGVFAAFATTRGTFLTEASYSLLSPAKNRETRFLDENSIHNVICPFRPAVVCRIRGARQRASSSTGSGTNSCSTYSRSTASSRLPGSSRDCSGCTTNSTRRNDRDGARAAIAAGRIVFCYSADADRSASSAGPTRIPVACRTAPRGAFRHSADCIANSAAGSTSSSSSADSAATCGSHASASSSPAACS